MKNNCQKNLIFCVILNIIRFDKTSSKILYLDEGDACMFSNGLAQRGICKIPQNCPLFNKMIESGNKTDICSFVGLIPIICCPAVEIEEKSQYVAQKFGNTTPIPNKIAERSNTADKKCQEYSELIYQYVSSPIIGSSRIIKIKDCYDIKIYFGPQLKEFPYMVLLGYDEMPIYNNRHCGGSLISDRWILTAAHCEKMDSNYALWARLGYVNLRLDTHDSRHRDYKIVQRIIHPDYNERFIYHDIALFRLEMNVEFSSYIRPVCLNTNQSLYHSKLTATGWETNVDGLAGLDMFRDNMNSIPVDRCNSLFRNSDNKLSHGITANNTGNMIICTSCENKRRNCTCGSDSGGPVHVVHPKYPCMHTQMGIALPGNFCDQKNTLFMFTRVSNYILWIEHIVWPMIK